MAQVRVALASLILTCTTLDMMSSCYVAAERKSCDPNRTAKYNVCTVSAKIWALEAVAPKILASKRSALKPPKTDD